MIRTPLTSPFAPGSDHIPEIWAGRQAELADFSAVVAPRRLAGLYERGRVVLGEPGIGKSVLVNRIAAAAKAEGHWVAEAVRLAAGEDAVSHLAEALRALVLSQSSDARIGAAAAGLLGRIDELTLPVVGGGVKIGDRADRNRHRGVLRLLVELGRLAHADRALVVLRLDEVQHLRGDELSKVLTVLGDALNEEVEERDPTGQVRRRKLPIAVYLSGLPEFSLRADKARTTFTRRFKLLDLEPLEDEDLREALLAFEGAGYPVLTDDGPACVTMERGAIDLVVHGCMGSPYLFQLIGDAAWSAGSGAVITRAEAQRGTAAARREIRANAELRVAGLTAKQLAYLRAAASIDTPARTAGAVAAVLGATSESLGPTARALDERHRLIRRLAGRVEFRSAAIERWLREDDPGG